jgi:hypothetical protein
MEDSKTVQPAPDIKERTTYLAPPQESRITTVLNGIGNGAMLGAVPFVVVELVDAVKNRGAEAVAGNNKTHLGAVFLTIAGCALGGWFGVKEGRKLHNYRLSVNDELTRIRHQVDAQDATIKTWAEKTSQPAPELVMSDSKAR